MLAAVGHAWDWRPVVAWRGRGSAAYLFAAGVVVIAVSIAACGSGASSRIFSLDATPYQRRPAALAGVRIPTDGAGVATIAARLPREVAGLERLPYGGWWTDERFVSAWGEPNGVAGTPPIQIVIRHLDPLGGQTVASGGIAVIADANRAVNIAGRLEVGRDGPIIWSSRSDAGYTVAWGRLDSPWLYVATASSERDLEAALLAFAQAAGAHGGRPSTVR